MNLEKSCHMPFILFPTTDSIEACMLRAGKAREEEDEEVDTDRSTVQLQATQQHTHTQTNKRTTPDVTTLVQTTSTDDRKKNENKAHDAPLPKQNTRATLATAKILSSSYSGVR